MADVFASSPRQLLCFVYIAVWICTLNLKYGNAAVKYSREALLDIGLAHHELTLSLMDFNFLLRRNPTNHNREGPTTPAVGDQCCRRRERTGWLRGKRGGLHARLKARATHPPLPSLLLANVRSLDNKMDELKTRITTQHEIRECCALIFTETWLSDSIPDSTIHLTAHSVHRGDRTVVSERKRGGGVCVYVNNSWCSDIQVVERHCSPDTELLMVKCRPFYLPREFSAVFLCVYIPPRADSATALRLLHDVINKHETTHPDAVFIAAGDFNHRNLKSILPKYHQQVNFPMRENNTLDQVYCNVKGAYKAVPRPHFGQSDHISAFLYPAYRQRLKQAPPVSTTVKVWNEETELVLQGCFESTN